jgi:hypothetical protein
MISLFPVEDASFCSIMTIPPLSHLIDLTKITGRARERRHTHTAVDLDDRKLLYLSHIRCEPCEDHAGSVRVKDETAYWVNAPLNTLFECCP